MAGEAVVVIDIGKSNAKLTLVDRASRATRAVRTTPNAVVAGAPYPHYDVERLWTWIIGGLQAFAAEAEIEAISVTTHGAAFALMAGDKLALPVLDYEHDLSAVAPAYDPIRGDFGETLSPKLPLGLNAGRQIFWQRANFPEAFATVDAILPYPQYWVFRLTGAKVAEATSLGSHTDLWNPRAGIYSSLAVSQGWDRLFPHLARPWDTVGPLLPDIAAATGIAAACRVVAGIHDSNASLLPHVLSRPRPFTVLSSGTWMVVFAPGGSLDRLDARRDCLANVDALGHAVPSSRFMAGREYEIISGGTAEPSAEDTARVVAELTMALPTFAPATGPFGVLPGRWATRGAPLASPVGLSPGERAAVASLYAGLVAETCVGLAGGEGPTIVEGPFARNTLFLRALAQRLRRPVIARPDAAGTTDGAVILTFGPHGALPDRPDPPPVELLDVDLSTYASAWHAALD